MKDLKLTIDLLTKGAWKNDLSKTLSKKDWDTLREFCYKKANGNCQICGAKTNDLDAHEVWEFNIKDKTQTLKDIIAICTKCHGVKHFKNSSRLGFGQSAKQHFMRVNNSSEMEFANHLTKAVIAYEELNKIYRWKMIANLDKFGGKNINWKQDFIPIIENPYKSVNWDILNQNDVYKMFKVVKDESIIGPPKIISLDEDNYQGVIKIDSLFTDRIEWYLDGKKSKTKYNVVGRFITSLSVKNLNGKNLYFKLYNQNGNLTSKNFILEGWK